MKIGSDPTLVASPTRAALLSMLVSGRAYTARELARATDASVAATRGHLTTLEQAGVLHQRRQGPHRYFQIASGPAAREACDAVAGAGDESYIVTGPRDPDLRAARVCYGHLAGPRAVRLYDRLSERALIRSDGEKLLHKELSF